MATAVLVRSSHEVSFDGDLDINSGQLGELFVLDNLINDISLIPGVNVPGLDKYYSVYSFTTETTINITLPTDINIGWRCRISMISRTGNGSLIIKDSNGITRAKLSSNITFGQSLASAEILFVGGQISWQTNYSIPVKGSVNQVISLGDINSPIARNMGFANYFSICDVQDGETIYINTVTETAIRWNNEKYQDNLFFDAFSEENTRIRVLLSGVIKILCVIGINNFDGANQNNLQIRPRINGTIFPETFSVILANVSPFANGVYQMEASLLVNANDYIEIIVNKTAVSIGTNLIDLVNSYIFIRYISY